MASPTEARLSNLEQIMVELAKSHARTQESLERTQESQKRTQESLERTQESQKRTQESQKRTQESQERTQENLELLGRGTREFQEEMRVFRDDTRNFKEEMRVFRVETRASSDEANRRVGELARQWGELANKMGTLVEDIVAPGIPEVFRKVFGIAEVPFFGIRVRRPHIKEAGRVQEFDVVAHGGSFFLVNETKSRIAPEDIPAFLSVLGEVRGFFPEAEGKKVVGALASFVVDQSLVTRGERQGLLMLGLSGGLLEILNRPGFKPREF